MDSQVLSDGVLWYVVFLLSLTCHEAAHALVASWGGDRTARAGGQATLNPLPHIRREPFGTVLFPIVSYFLSAAQGAGWMIGWGSAPYDRLWQQRYPRRAACMALAGPAANTTLALLAAAGIRAGLAARLLVPGDARFVRIVVARVPGVWEGAAIFLSILFSLNLLLATFNLLPIPPLDGNTAIGLVLPARAALGFARLSHNRTFAMAGLLLGWYLFGYIFGPVFQKALHLLFAGAP